MPDARTVSLEAGMAEVMTPRPHNPEAEQALLGALLANNAAYDQVPYLRREHFADAAHGRIFGAIGEMVAGGHVATPVTLKNRFDADGDLADVGGAAYLAELAGSIIQASGVGDYGKLIYDLALRRRLLDIVDDVRAEAGSFDIDLMARMIGDRAMARLAALLDGDGRDGGLRALDELAAQAIEHASAAVAANVDGRLLGVTTGLRALDDFTGGWQPGQLVVLAARPGMGKTILGTQAAVAAGAARADATVALFSLEMSGVELVNRVLSARTGFSYKQIGQGHLPADGLDRLAAARAELASVGLWIDDSAAMSVPAMAAAARGLMRRRGGLDLVVVDHLGLAEPSDWQRSRSSGNRTQDVAEISRGLKVLAKQLGVPVLALCQLNRGVEGRDDKRPSLADLRDSGAIEQDADAVIFIYRAEYYVDRRAPERKERETRDSYDARFLDWQERRAEIAGKAELIVAKQRVGPLGTVPCLFDGATSRFMDSEERQ